VCQFGGDTVSSNVFNLKRQFTSKHEDTVPVLSSNARTRKINEMALNFRRQQQNVLQPEEKCTK
jgi:hypothetical protein